MSDRSHDGDFAEVPSPQPANSPDNSANLSDDDSADEASQFPQDLIDPNLQILGPDLPAEQPAATMAPMSQPTPTTIVLNIQLPAQHTAPNPPAPQAWPLGVDIFQRDECMALVRLFRQSLEESLNMHGENSLWDIAMPGEWSRELFRVECQRPGYLIVLYAVKLVDNAAISLWDQLFWSDLEAAARLGVNRGALFIASFRVGFMRTRMLAADNDLENFTNAVSNAEYWG
ncbi:hypothetical protein F4821DRAFT_256983 [Hypoxylon rubiginosum]|uniref:Uncharacterized protein n=1 Tax=Hypoxylon rubiginosum TaxID=110542 RepID=A0ACC0DAI8_9PEZI|nr:hypothetical protein F4821DRAFT_256983 [Hypoxylon rubiginosum]